MPRDLAVDAPCRFKRRPGLSIPWERGRVLELELHHVLVIPLHRGDAQPLRLPRGLVELPKERERRVRRAIAGVRAALGAGEQDPGSREQHTGAEHAGHRHLKPDNVLFDPGEKRLVTSSPPVAAIVPFNPLDKLVLDNQRPAYMAPEQEVRTVRLDGAPRPVPKPTPPFRSRAYLHYVRTHPCCACQRPAPSQAHHWGPRGVGQKTSDLRTVPLCRRCHRAWHRHGTLPGLVLAAAQELLLRTQVGLLVVWIEGGC